MTGRPTADLLAWVARQVHPDASVSAVSPLRGGITASMHRVSLTAPVGKRDVVLREWPDAAWADGLVAREVAALDVVADSGVPAPRLVAADPDGAATGARCTVTTLLPGAPDLAPADLPSWTHQLAGAQAAIHAVPRHPPTRWDGWYDEGYEEEGDRFSIRDRPLDWIGDPGLRVAARQAADGPVDRARVFVHGDYQHFNVLWHDGRLTGVVDWPNAATGRRGSDVGHCRLNLAVLFDAEVAAEYLAAYERAADATVDRVADLRALLCFDREWQAFIPVQVAGRAPLDVAGMAGRVSATVRAAVEALG